MPSPTGRVLVADRDSDLRALAQAVLVRAGYAVTTADGGLDALACSSARPRRRRTSRQGMRPARTTTSASRSVRASWYTASTPCSPRPVSISTDRQGCECTTEVPSLTTQRRADRHEIALGVIGGVGLACAEPLNVSR